MPDVKPNIGHPDAPNTGALNPDAAKPDARNIERDDVYEAEQLAIRTGITGDQAQELIDRIGSDRVALEEAARNLRARDD